MRRYKISYFFSQAFKGLWRNGMMTLASVTVLLSCLIVMGCFSMLVINIDHNLESLGDLNEIVAFADTDEPYEAEAEAVLAPAIKSEGKTFLGWSVNPDAEAADFGAGKTYKINPEDAVSGVITMYAIWEEKSVSDGYKIKYNASGLNIEGSLPENPDSYQEGDALSLADALTARYSTIEFLGWSLSPDSEEAEYLSNAEYTVSSEDAKGGVITFYAVWSEKQTFATYKLVYDANDAEVSDMPTDSGVRLDRIRKQLEGLDNISENGIEFVSKEETLESEKEKLKDYPSLLATLEEGDNPYPDSFIITYKDNSSVSALQLQLDNIEGIYKTRCRADIAENIESLKSGIILIFTWFMVILFVVSIFVIINTVKLAVVGRSKEITIMRYVGATKWFIALPFELEGAIIGLFSGIAAFFVQWYMYGYVQKMIMNEIQMISILPFDNLKLVMFVGCVVIGVITGLIGSVISIRKYLKA